MGVELDHSFTMAHGADENFATILDLERVIPCVEGGSVTEKTGDDSVKAEIKVKMGAMSMTFNGTVEVTEKDPAAHTATLVVKSREVRGQGNANAVVEFKVSDDGGSIHTDATITGKPASMGRGVIVGVLDGLINDFAGKLSKL
jgi:carbon monoxide dehydrogenase subunit G